MTQTIKISSLKKPVEPEVVRKSNIQIETKEGELYVTGLPDKDTLEYVARNNTDSVFYYVVHRPEKEWHYKDFRLHIGQEAQLVEAIVNNVDRYKDGGTTNIFYTLAGADGTLHFPTPFAKEEKPTDTYKGKTVELEKLV